MPLRLKTFLITFCMLAALSVVLFLALNFIVMSGFDKIEQDYITRDLLWIDSEIRERVKVLSSTLSDWAIWDDTYQFIKDLNEQYITSNISLSSFKNINVNLMLFYDSAGNLKYEKAYDFKLKKEIPVNDEIKQNIKIIPEFFTRKNKDKFIAGILQANGRILITSSHPILTSFGEGPEHGILVFGFYLDDIVISEISRKLGKPVLIYPFNSPDLPADMKKAKSDFKKSKPLVIKKVNSNLAYGYLYFNDITGKPAAIIRVNNYRTIYRQGKSSLLYFTIAMTLLGMASVVGYLFLMEKIIISRLISLNKDVKRIGEDPDSSGRVEEKGSDEIAELAREINKMLIRIEKSRESLQDSETRYENLVENLDVGVIRYLLAPQARLLNINKEALKIFGFKSEEEAVNTPFINCFADSEQVIPLIDLLRKKGSLRGFEVELKKTDGSTFWASLTVKHSYNEKDGREIVEGVIEDITAKREIQKLLQDRNRELSDFTQAVSHDLKNPLNIIKGYLIAIHEAPELFSQYFEKTIRQTDHLIGFVDKLLKLARAGKVIGEKTIINLEDLARQAYLSVKSNHSDFNFVVLSKSTEIEADHWGFTQIFTNLIQNSIIFRNPDLENLVVTFECKREDGSVLMKLSDNGIGIERENLGQIFTPGFTTIKFKGNGFGLAIVKKIVEAHEGTIWAESEGKNKGSTFYIRIPVKEGRRNIC